MKFKKWPQRLGAAVILAAAMVGFAASCHDDAPANEPGAGAGAAGDQGEVQAEANSQKPRILRPQFRRSMIEAGKATFRYDTFGDEIFWTDQLKLHRAIAGAAHGGVGAGVSPNTAVQVGLKVDAEALPKNLVASIEAGQVDLDDPATTLALLKLNAVVGLTGKLNPDGTLKSIGIQCALCHSTVDDSFAPGIGKRLDGWPNRDLDVGAIISLAPDLGAISGLLEVSDATVRNVLAAWGPGKFDAELILDGKGFRPDGKTAATLIPPAFGLAGVNLHTFEGWGSIPYWNAFVANLEMHGQGNFYDPRLDDASTFPIAAKNKLGHVHNETDLISSKLGALQAYQLSLVAPTPPLGSYDKAAAKRGDELFSGKARCASCHVEPTGAEPGWPMHSPAEIGIDDFQANRSPDKMYRTTPLRGLWSHQKGGFFHDGRFATLPDVIDHYDHFFELGLTPAEKSDLVEYLKSL
jgi:hypothetical protein